MSSAIGDISSGLVGVSHTTGDEYKALPSKSAIKPAGGTMTLHTEKVLANNKPANRLLESLKPSELSYSPELNGELRSSVISLISDIPKDGFSKNDKKDLAELSVLLQRDSNLEADFKMARSILMPV